MTRDVILPHAVLALLLAAPLAGAQRSDVCLHQPASGTTLIGGSSTVIQWSGPVASDPDIEEWEAFLSVDGGRYYSVRITPHLSTSIREFRWTVPNVTSSDARILLRFGNEETEHIIELPVSLTIQAAPVQRIFTDKVATLGEAARPGDPGVIQWAVGDRVGSSVTVVTASLPTYAAVSEAVGGGGSEMAMQPIGCAAASAASQSASLMAAMPAQRPVTQRFRSEVLLHCCRRNI